MSGILDFLGGELPPWDRGSLEAHKISAGPTDLVERCLNEAKRRRRGPLSWLSRSRRRYLDGMIGGLEGTLEWRKREILRRRAMKAEQGMS